MFSLIFSVTIARTIPCRSAGVQTQIKEDCSVVLCEVA